MLKDKTYVLNTLLAGVVMLALLICIVVRAFLPAWILPELNIPNMVLLSLIALLLDHYLAKDAKRCYICIPVFAAVTFGLLPWVSGFAGAEEIWVLALSGAVVFTTVTLLFSSIQTRLSSGPAKKLAPFMSAFGLYLAFQCFAGMLL